MTGLLSIIGDISARTAIVRHTVKEVQIRPAVLRKYLPLYVLAGILGFLSPTSTKAFSLLGPFAPWMGPQVGMALPDDIGGPMNLGEEYRWNVPVLTYAFDQSFLEYFGSNGVAAVESAIEILNDLPPASLVEPTNYPPRASFMNYRADAEGLYDLKSQILALLLEQLGLAAPSRFTFCVRNFVMLDGKPQVVVIQRNYDPGTWTPSTQVDNAVYDYYLAYGPGNPPESVDAVEYHADGSSIPSPAVADASLGVGILYVGLTRDDVGGLRYLLHPNNLNAERLLSDVHGAGTNADAFVDQATRGGVDKIVFVATEYDSLTGRLVRPYTNLFTDTFLTNGIRQQQQLERIVTQPDILFSSADLRDGTLPAPRVFRTGTTNWLACATPDASGPGIIRPRIDIVLHRPDFRLETADSPNDGSVAVTEFEDYRWGSFDLSTNPPVVYPAGSATPRTNEMSVELELVSTPLPSPRIFLWHIPLELGANAEIQTSTNLVNWESRLPIVNRGLPLVWRHSCSSPQRYFRIVPQ